MRSVFYLLSLLAFVIPVKSQSLTVLLLPPPLLPENADAQKALTKSLPLVWQKVLGKWSLVTFHRESPSIQRALREGKISPEVLLKPYENANVLCLIEGAKAALWFRAKSKDEGVLKGIEARLLVPVDLRFESDLEENPLTEEEKKLLRPISGRNPPSPELILALRLGQWLYQQLKPTLEEVEPNQQIPTDANAAKALMAEGKWDEAIALLSKLVLDSPQEPNLYLLLGQAYEGRQKWEDALMEYRRAVYLQSELWEAWEGIARVSAQRGRWDLTLTAVRQLRRSPEIEPHYLALGARAAMILASNAKKRGREKEAEVFSKEAIEFDSRLLQLTSDFSLILDAAERLQANGDSNLATEALKKLATNLITDQIAAERVLRLAWMLKNYEVALSFLFALASVSEKVALGYDAFRIATSVLDREIVRLFEQVRENLFAFDATKLSREDLQERLKQTNTSAEQLLRLAYKLQTPEPLAKIHNHRLLCCELFLQATELMLQWIEQPDDLTRKRAIVLYEFARKELEQAQKEDKRLR
ncbi:MAG: hypothetical protein NZ937_02735 [Armatimonadetes bacterium]|nr:hypothetical protein [Armatimonadota bacterium]